MKNLLKTLPDALLILLFVYAAVSKLLDFDDFRGQLYNQTFPHAWANFLLYTLPPVELLAAGLLAFERSRLYGLGLSLWLLLCFTGYIALVELHFWDRVPCSCGGILSHMSWSVHLYFNLIFIAITIIGLLIRPTGEAENPEQSRHHYFT